MEPTETPALVLTPVKKKVSDKISLPDEWTKDTEQSFFERLYWVFKGTDTYLSDFFTERLLAEVQQRIRDDFPCDLFGDLVHTGEKADRLEQEKHDLETTINEQKEAIGLMADAIKKLEGERDEARGGLVAAQQTISDLEAQIEDQQVDLGVRDFRIVELKAKLYDMEHPQQ